MALANHPVWPFEPNWSSSVGEMLEWLTDIMTSPTGSEQRRSLRFFPRRALEFSIAADGDERTLLDNMLISFSGQRWWVPLWYDVNLSSVATLPAATFIPCPDAISSGIKPGGAIFIAGDSVYDGRLVEVVDVTTAGIQLLLPLSGVLPRGTRIFPAVTAKFTDQPRLSKYTDKVVTSEVRFQVLDANSDVGAPVITAGPLIVDGLIVNAYHHETGRGGYFHYHSGTSEGQFIFIYGLYLAYEQLRNGSNAEKRVADYYRLLAEQMLDAMGDGSPTGPMLRQPVPADPDTLTLIHWLFAARGDVPGQQVIYAYEVAPVGGKLVIPANAEGSKVFHVWAIYPGTSELLFNNPYSPAFDIVAPGAPTQIELTQANWQRVGSTTEITIPPGTPAQASWKILFGYNTETIIPIKHGFEAYPNWTPIEPGYSACAPDTFRWFDQAMTKAMLWDNRPETGAKWDRLRAAMRRTAIKGQSISDLREVIQPMPGFDPIPVKGAPDGMFCYSDHPSALVPTAPGTNPGWRGYDFWNRDDNGDIIASIPYTTVLNQVQIGRGFSDQWREETAYQEADQYLYVAVSATKKPDAGDNEHFMVYVSSTMTFSAETRWYADIGALAQFVPSDDVIEFFIPRSAFRLRSYGSGGETIWGSTLPAGTELENFGISSEMRGDYSIRLRAVRLVSGPSSAWVDANKAVAIKGSKMPFFPGSMPFAINADLRRQQFVGWNGSPFHGYQLADFWWWLGADADLLHPTLTVADLPIPNPTTGALTYPISPTTAGSVAKPKNALLMEQQLMFLKHAQDQFAADGGAAGIFAHTFVLNTPARKSLGNPTPHTWVYVNDDPNTRWVGYQTRLVESMAELIYLTSGAPAFADSRALALTMTMAWLTRLNVLWPDLTGKLVEGVRIYGMPTDYDDPAISAPQTLYEEPHAAAHVMRACIMLRKSGAGDATLVNALIVRCWQYLELVWRTSGEMRFTWSPDPAAKQWYGFWHGDIIATLAIALDNAPLMPAGVNMTTVRQRLVQTQQWLQETGVGFARPDPATGLTDTYLDFLVLPVAPDEDSRLDVSFERMMEDLDNQISIPQFRDTAGRSFNVQKHAWTINGRAEHVQFRALLDSLRGRAIPIWLPTFMQDFKLAQSVPAGSSNIVVERAGFTQSGGPRWDRQHIMIETDTERFYRKIMLSAVTGEGTEILNVDQPFFDGIPMRSVVRICFMTLVRQNQDSVEIEHVTDTKGVSKVSTTFRSAPNTRVPDPAFYE